MSGDRVPDRLGPLVVVREPVTRAPVQHIDELRRLLCQPGSQHVCEQVVIAVPLPPVVERNQEQVAAIEGLEHGLAAALPGDRVAQRAVEPVQDGGVQQELADLAGLALQHLLDQVVDDVAVVPREAGDEPGDVVSSLHRQRRQLQGGDPPFGTPLQRRHVRGRQLQAHHLVEVRRSLVRREPQVGGTDLDQLATRSQPRQRQRRVSAAGDHEVQPRRQVVEQERHRVLDLAGVDQVVVVEHQHDVAAGRAEVVEQRRQHHLDRGRLRRGQELQLVRADPGRHRPQRRDQVAPEGHRVVVTRVERQPRGESFAGRRGRSREPLREQPGLAETGRCGDEGQLRRGPAVQLLVQPRTRHQARSWPGPIELRLQQGASHRRLLSRA